MKIIKLLIYYKVIHNIKMINLISKNLKKKNKFAKLN
jgi:hypothetical protein